MDKRKLENQRVKRSITQALFHLLEEKSISEITISEIIRMAGVARASFYRNYSSKESVLVTLIADVLEDFRTNMKCDGDNFYTYENVHLSFEYFSKYEKQMLDLHRFGYGSILLYMLDSFHGEVAGDMPNNSIDKYSLYIYIGALYNTALVWLENGKKWSTTEIADFFYKKCLT